MTNFVEISSLETNTHAQYSRPKLTFLPIGGFPMKLKPKRDILVIFVIIISLYENMITTICELWSPWQEKYENENFEGENYEVIVYPLNIFLSTNRQ